MASYVISDIHGLWDRYEKLLATLKLKETDRLYVLGDVVDRGKNGIRILLDIMQQSNIQLLMGNHEYMMLQYYECKFHKKFNNEEEKIIVNRWNRNGNIPTIQQFEALNQELQNKLLQYLATSPIAVCDVVAGNYKYYLVHGHPCMNINKGTIYATDLIDETSTIENFIWDRWEVGNDVFGDRCIVIGHTPTLYFQEEHPFKVWTNGDCLNDAKIINIDCGCAVNDSDTRLACLCLENREVIYI